MGSEVAPWCKSFVSYTCCPKVEESPAEFQKAGDPQHFLKRMTKGKNIKNMEGVDKITEDDIGCAASSSPPSKKKKKAESGRMGATAQFGAFVLLNHDGFSRNGTSWMRGDDAGPARAAR